MSTKVAEMGRDDLPTSISSIDTTPGEYVQKTIVDGTGEVDVHWFDLSTLGVSAVSLYTGDGTLEEDRTVTGDGNDIIFTGNPLFAVRTTTLIDLDGAVTINESSASVDLRVESNGNANMLVVDGSADAVGIGTATPAKTLDVVGTFGVSGGAVLEGATVINEAGASVDTRIEGDTEVNLVFVDASTDRVGIGTATPSVLFDVNGAANVTGAFTTVGAVTMNDAGADVNVRVETDNDANAFTIDGGLDAVGIGIALGAQAAKLDVSQVSTTGAKPVLQLTQADVDQAFAKFIGTSAAGNTNSFVDAADLTTPGTLTGWIRIVIQDDAVAGSISDGTYFVPFYTAPTA